MKRLLRPVSHRYTRWMNAWEEELCFRATDRVVRPFEYGLEWTEDWPQLPARVASESNALAYVAELNRYYIENAGLLFSYETPASFHLNGNELSFESPVRTPYAENNIARALWFPAKQNRSKAVVVLPHWNSKLPQHNALCAGLQRLGISALRLSLPYHDRRMPAGLARADAMSANICRTIDAARQAVVDTRCSFDWLEQEGFTDLGIVGTSIGSCYAFLASAFDERVRVNCFNHCSTYVADVVWEGLSTRHVRDSLISAIDLETLRKLWLCISPPSYWEPYTAGAKHSKFIYTEYDTTFPVHLSRQVIEGARKHNWKHDVTVLPCGHYTQGEFPFKYITGYQICAFIKRHL